MTLEEIKEIQTTLQEARVEVNSLLNDMEMLGTIASRVGLVTEQLRRIDTKLLKSITNPRYKVVNPKVVEIVRDI